VQNPRLASSAGKETPALQKTPVLIPGSGSSPGEEAGYLLQYSWVPPGGADGKESTCNEGELGSIPGLGRSQSSPGEGKDYPLQYSCLENPQGKRSLVGHSPQSHKESDMTEAT